jgi:hypothetical protein
LKKLFIIEYRIGVDMYPKKSEEFTRISFKISNELLADFKEYALSKNYQQLEEAIIDLIKREIKEK